MPKITAAYFFSYSLSFVLTACLLLSTVQAQTTSFNYQGRLNDTSTPTPSAYDFEFRLYDALSGGNQIGPINERRSVTVTSGVFNVTLDFGAAAFPGAARFLEIRVGAAGSNTFTLLTPRRPINSVPYSVKSLGADSLSAACNGCVTDAQIAAVAGNKIAGTIPAASLPSNSDKYIQNTTAQQTNSNFNITGNGTIGGNLITNGNLGIGISNPAGLLHVRGANPVRILGDTTTLSGTESVDFFARSSLFSSDLGGMRIQRQNSGDIDTLFFAALGGNSASEFMRISGNGNVGINTKTPLGKLQVTTANDTNPFTHVWDARHFVIGGAGNVGGIGMSYDQTNGIGYIHALSPFVAWRNLALQYDGGNVGIGTATPTWKLHVVAPHNGLMRVESSAAFGTWQELANTSEGGRAWQMISTGPTNGEGAGNLLFRDGTLESVRMMINTTGNVGIATVFPVDRLQVVGDIRVGANSLGCVKNGGGSVIAGTCSSDLRFKQQIAPFPNLLDKLTRLQPVHFYWRAEEFPERHFGAEQSYGLIAQEVEKVLPELVTKDEEGYRAVNYSKLPLLLLQATKEQQQQIEKLKQQNTQLLEQNAALQKANAAIEARLAALEKLLQQTTSATPEKK